MVAPGRSQVLSLVPEYIVPQDGHDKQACEWVAAKRWLKYQAGQFEPYSMTLLGDDLNSILILTLLSHTENCCETC